MLELFAAISLATKAGNWYIEHRHIKAAQKACIQQEQCDGLEYLMEAHAADKARPKWWQVWKVSK